MLRRRAHTVPARAGFQHRAALTLCLIAAAAWLHGPTAAAAQTAIPCPADGTTPTGSGRLHITVTHAHSAAGNVTFTIYGERQAAFMAHHGWIARASAPLSGSSAEACFVLSAPGTYAVAVFHDENNNHHFDRTLVGLPAEGYGFSNDAPTPIGLPSFAAARIMVQPGENHIAIKLRY